MHVVVIAAGVGFSGYRHFDERSSLIYLIIRLVFVKCVTEYHSILFKLDGAVKQLKMFAQAPVFVSTHSGNVGTAIVQHKDTGGAVLFVCQGVVRLLSH